MSIAYAFPARARVGKLDENGAICPGCAAGMKRRAEHGWWSESTSVGCGTGQDMHSSRGQAVWQELPEKLHDIGEIPT